MANLPELDRVIAHCEANPERHDQGTWFDTPERAWTDIDEGTLAPDWQCHTTACVAGWAAILNGWRPMWTDSTKMLHSATGEVEQVITVARRLLGLTAPQAAVLFTETFDLADVRRVVERIRTEQTVEG